MWYEHAEKIQNRKRYYKDDPFKPPKNWIIWPNGKVNSYCKIACDVTPQKHKIK